MILKYIGLLGINIIRDSEIPQPKLQSTLQTMKPKPRITINKSPLKYILKPQINKIIINKKTKA